MSLENINTERIIRARGMSSDNGSENLEYPVAPEFGHITPRINHHQDQRGSLFALNFPELPFKCRRMFVVTGTPKGMIRGKHAHYKTEQVLLCISGKIEIKLDRVFSERTEILTPGKSLFHSAMEWAEIKFVEENSVLLSACSTDFDPDDYIGNYVQFQSLMMTLDLNRKKLIAEQEALLQQELLHPVNASVPILDLKANYESIKDEVNEAIMKVLDRAYYVNGPEVELFEKQYASFVGTKHCIGVSNGTDALVLALKALDIGSGDEVILQGNAFIADAMAIDDVGAKMVFVDHDDSFQLDLDMVESAITEKTKAILVVHLYGSCCNMSQLVNICHNRNIKLIEDCAHAHGATWQGKCVGSFGDIGTWSFYPAKNLGAYGDAGGLTTDSDEIRDRIRLLKNYGSQRKYYSDTKGLNYRLDTIHAAVLSVKLQYIQQWNRRRQEIARMYLELLRDVGDITFPTIVDGCLPVYHQFVISTNRRDALIDWLKENYNIDVFIHYPVPIHKQKAFENEYGSSSASIPRSESSCKLILSLPMCPMMADSMVMTVVSAVKSFYLRC